MHDIDRTQRQLELESAHEQEHEHEHEGEAFIGSLFGAHEQEHEHEAESPLSETQEMELASELLGASSEAELEHFHCARVAVVRPAVVIGKACYRRRSRVSRARR
jgi:hypothetical protein